MMKKKKRGPFCPNGGLSLVPLPGHELQAIQLKEAIEALDPNHYTKTYVDIADPRFSTYSSNETYFRCSNEHIVEHDCVILGSGPMPDSMLMKLLWTIGLLGGRHAGRISIFTGYFPHSRSDKDEGSDILSTLPILHAAIEGLAGRNGVNRWICFDPHSEQITSSGRSGLVTPVYLTGKLLRFAIDTARSGHAPELNIVLGFPDSSAEKRYRRVISALEDERKENFPRVIIDKERRGSDTEIVNIRGDKEAVAGARVLMFDDEVATGGSSLNMARVMKTDYKAESIYMCATHAVMCGNANEHFLNQVEHLGGQWIDHMIFADSIPIHGRAGIEALI